MKSDYFQSKFQVPVELNRYISKLKCHSLAQSLVIPWIVNCIGYGLILFTWLCSKPLRNSVLLDNARLLNGAKHIEISNNHILTSEKYSAPDQGVYHEQTKHSRHSSIKAPNSTKNAFRTWHMAITFFLTQDLRLLQQGLEVIMLSSVWHRMQKALNYNQHSAKTPDYSHAKSGQ